MSGRLGWGRERGAAAVEFVLIVPVLMLVVGVMVGGARIWFARSTITQVADSAARAASLAREPATAQADAAQVAQLDLTAGDVTCVGGPSVTVDTSGFSVPVGQPASVGVRVGCLVALSDLVVPGLPGVLPVEASSSSTLDRYRGRR